MVWYHIAMSPNIQNAIFSDHLEHPSLSPWTLHSGGLSLPMYVLYVPNVRAWGPIPQGPAYIISAWR